MLVLLGRDRDETGRYGGTLGRNAVHFIEKCAAL